MGFSLLKHSVLALVLISLIHVLAHAQSRPTAGRIMGASGAPVGACNSSTTLTDIYIRSDVSPRTMYLCSAGVWVLFASGGVPGGSNTQIQFNSSSAFGGDAGLTYNSGTDTLTITGLLLLGSTPVTISDAAGKILSAALNTVAVGQGGTGLTTVTSNALVKGNAAGAMVVTGVTVDGSNNISTAGTVTAASYATSATSAGSVTLSEPTGTGSDGVTLSAPASVTSSYTMKMPAAAAAGVLRFDGTDAITFVAPSEKVWLPAAGCVNTTAASFWDLPTTTPAVAACVTGTNIQKGVLQYADTSGGFSAQNGFLLPTDFTGTVDANIIWKTTATSGNAKFSLSTICTAVTAIETDDPAFNTASTVVTAAPGTANRLQTSPITTVTITGCAAGELFHVKLFRDGNDGSDTLSASLDVIGVEISYRRNIQ